MRERVLVVEDNEDNRKIVCLILEAEGYETIQASDGEEGLNLVATERPDLVLLDINMPKLDGFEVCRRLKQNSETSSVPVIFLTAQSSRENKIKGLDIGGADYVVKPYDKGEVIARVRSQLKIQSLVRKLSEANTQLKDKQQRLDEDLKAAAEIQRSLLPKNLPDIRSIDVAWQFLPCEFIAGDIFNVFRLDDRHLALYMLDVSGHGVPSALVTASVAQSLQFPNHRSSNGSHGVSSATSVVSPSAVLEALDREFPIERFDKFVTVIYIVLDIHTGTFVYSNAAHPPPIILGKDGRFEFLTRGGTIIGMGGIVSFEEEEKNLSKGDKIILYTDGIVEYQNEKGDFYGEDRFFSLLKAGREQPVGHILEEVITSLRAFGDGAHPRDDVSLLGIEYQGPQG